MGILRGPKIMPASDAKGAPATPDRETTLFKTQENFTAGTMASMKKNPGDSVNGAFAESKT